MNVEIARTQRCILELFHHQRAYLAGKPRQFVEDLKHESSDLHLHEDFSMRTAAEINRVACIMVLEKVEKVAKVASPALRGAAQEANPS